MFLLAQDEEIEQLINRFTSQPAHGVAVQQLELLLREALRKPANELIGVLLQNAASQIDQNYQPKPGECWKGTFPIEVHGVFGSFQVWRDYYYDASSKRGRHPADAALGLEGACTPALTKLVCYEGAEAESFLNAQEHLQNTGAIQIDPRQVQRIVQHMGASLHAWPRREAKPEPCNAPILYVSADATGVPMRKAILAGRKGKQPDGSAKTQSANMACVFTQHTRDEEGRPIRDYESTTYVGGMDNVEELGLLLRKEALRRGSATAKEIVVLIDGAACLETLGKINFPGCTQIVDFYHAMEHLDALIDLLLGKEHPDHKKQYSRWTKRLLKDGVNDIVAQARQMSEGKASAQAVEKALGYFIRNTARMQYGSFRKKGYFIGSGVIEAGCKTLVGKRCKQSGMFWSQKGVANIISLRCILRSRQWDAFWKTRANQLAALNDSLPLAA